MNRNAIKFIAAFTMVLDHIGFYLLDSETVLYLVFRSIGRVAFVLFAYMIVEGFRHTRDLKKYFLRLFVFAAAIELVLIGYWLIGGENFSLFSANSGNVIWPLVFGLGGLWLLSNDNIWIRLSSILVVALSIVLNIPYAGYGVLMILIFGLYPNILTQFLFLIGLNLLFIQVPFLEYVGKGDWARYPADMWWQWFSLAAFLFIPFYNHKKGKWNTKYFFYVFYPVHIGIILLIGLFIRG
ncbi:MAG: hypothetical protein JXB08_04925 [Bacilli bacterium]|nr:hypothetical protein [Bacilli bacterium]MBN2877477.1 hypothetical protein [Bacilli bacterium]